MVDATNEITRKSSGYVRDFNAMDVFVINVLGYSIGLAICTSPPFIGAMAPSSEMWIVAVLGSLVALCNGLVYGTFGGLIPCTGGDYHFVGRTLNHQLGFIASWGFTVANTFGLAFNILSFFTAGVVPALVTIGYALKVPAISDWGYWLAGPQATLACAICFLGILVIISLSGAGLSKVFLYPLFFCAVTGTVLMGIVLIRATHADFVSSLNNYASSRLGVQDFYSDCLKRAADHGVVLGTPSTIGAAFKALPLGFLCFVGFNYSVYMGGEVREPLKSQRRGIMSALIFGLIAFGILFSAYSNVVGRDFIAAIGVGSVDSTVVPTISTSFYVGLLSVDNIIILIAMHLLNLAWFLTVTFVILQVCVRNVIAWSLDGMFLKSALRRSSMTSAPWVAILLVSFAALGWMLTGIYFSSLSLVGAGALLAIPLGLTGFSAFLAPKTLRRRWDVAPPQVRKEFLGFHLFQVCGFLSIICSVWIGYVSLSAEISGGSSGVKAFCYLVVVYGIGIAVYSRFRRQLIRSIPGGKDGLTKFHQVFPSD
ncbi:MAG: APC family permease [Pirellula sp.]